MRFFMGRPIYYGWPMLTAVSTAQVVSWGILYYAFSVFLTPMQAELGWTTVELTGAYSLMLLCGGLAALPVGRWLDRHGPRALMSAACAGLVAGAQPADVLPDHGGDRLRLSSGAV
jgi:MFS family permease